MTYQPANYGGFERSKRDIEYDHSRDSIQNAYGRFLSQQRGQRSLGDLDRVFQRNTPGFQASFGQRGLSGPGVRSGVRRELTDQFVGDYARDRGRLSQDITQEAQQYDLNQFNANAYRDNALADLEARKADEIAWTAQNLEYLRSLIGGL